MAVATFSRERGAPTATASGGKWLQAASLTKKKTKKAKTLDLQIHLRKNYGSKKTIDPKKIHETTYKKVTNLKIQ